MILSRLASVFDILWQQEVADYLGGTGSLGHLVNLSEWPV